MSRNLLTKDEIAAMLMALDGWKQEGQAIRRTFTFKDFTTAFSFMSSVADKAEELDHHPDWSNAWNKVEVSLSTHSAGGLTALDFALAAFMDEAATW